MTRDRDPFERARSTLRQRLREGTLGQGRPLHIARLAADLKISPTPVREALAWLAGEGLIDRGPAGYLTWRYDTAAVADLYRLDAAIALAALNPPPHGDLRRDQTPAMAHADFAERTEAALTVFAPTRGAGARRVREALWIQLAPFRRAEPLALPDAARDLEQLVLSMGEAGAGGRLRAYYRRRDRAAGDLLAEILRAESPPDIP